MKVIDKVALLVMFISMAMLDSESPVPFVISFITTGYLLVRAIRGDLDV